jgi:hypothetical protein
VRSVAITGQIGVDEQKLCKIVSKTREILGGTVENCLRPVVKNRENSCGRVENVFRSVVVGEEGNFFCRLVLDQTTNSFFLYHFEEKNSTYCRDSVRSLALPVNKFVFFSLLIV